MKIGIIGVGKMGMMIAKCLLDAQAISEEELMISSRSKDNSTEIKKQYPGIQIEDDAQCIVRDADILFFFIKAKDYLRIHSSIVPCLTPKKCILISFSQMTLDVLQTKIPCPVGRIIPSITNSNQKGNVLLQLSSLFQSEWKEKLTPLLETIGTVKIVSENTLRPCADISSCMPAWMCHFLKQFGKSSSKLSVNETEATQILTNTLIGVGSLLESGWSLDEIIQRVTVPNGITQTGIEHLDRIQSNIDELMHTTFDRYMTEKKEIDLAFLNQ
jgi:competence protein ComER